MPDSYSQTFPTVSGTVYLTSQILLPLLTVSALHPQQLLHVFRHLRQLAALAQIPSIVILAQRQANVKHATNNKPR
ncbi:MAG: hypothetical protein ABIN01_13965 [Ferruginibacter sp.]